MLEKTDLFDEEPDRLVPALNRLVLLPLLAAPVRRAVPGAAAVPADSDNS
ncbi:MAG: hypothetical protein M0Z84_09250 [Gammaproteobacteria bacterium]|nr:hypothetical protein [Gammaproteobacteria bacterium]